MPYDWNNILVVTKEELIPAFWKDYFGLQKAMKRAEKRGYGIRRVQNGGGGHPLLIDFDSLPNHIKEALGDPRKVDHILEKYFEMAQEVVDFYTDYRYDDGSYIRKETIDDYIVNACMWRALEGLKADRESEIISKRGSLKHVMGSLCTDAVLFQPILKAKWGVEHSLPENERRFNERFKLYLEGGLLALLNKNKGNKNAALLNDETLALLNNMFGTQAFKPTYVDVAKQYEKFLAGTVDITNEKTGEIYNPDDFKLLSRSTIYNYLKEWGNAIGTEAKRSGDRQKLMGKFKPGHALDKPKFSGSLLSIDDRNPPFEYAKGCRVWFYLGQDVASDAITTWVWGKDKKGIIVDFYRQMVRNYAEWGLCLPAELECESSLNSTFKETLLKEGNMFQYVRIEANNARGKYIEQGFNRKIRYGQEKQHKGWIARPFAKSESNQEGSNNVPLIAYNDIIEQGLKDIEIWNNSPISEGSTITRWEYFMDNQNPKLTPINYKNILPYLGEKTKTSCNAGIIKLQGKKRLLGDDGEIFTGEKLINLMKKVEGQDVFIYWLDGNDGEVLKALVYLDDQLVCEALPIPRYVKARIEQTDADKAARELMSRYVATIDGYASKQRKALDPVTVIDNSTPMLNNKFKIASIQPRAALAENIDFENEILNERDENEEDLISVSTPIKRLQDRF